MSFVLKILITVSLVAFGCSDPDPAHPTPDTGNGTDMSDLGAQDAAPDVSDPSDLGEDHDAGGDQDFDDPNPPAHVRTLRPAASGMIRAGISTLSLDPPVGVSMAGYGNRTSGGKSPWAGMFGGSQGTHGALWVKALALEVDGERLIFLKVPLVFSDDFLTQMTTTILQERHGLDLEGRVIFGATHTHHGPARFWRIPAQLGIGGIDSPDPQIISILASQMAEAVAQAVQDLEPAEWGHTKVEDWDPDDQVYRDRRPVNDHLWGKDPRLTVLAVRRNGLPLAVMANFGMHGTIADPSNVLLSEDAAGGFEEELEVQLLAKFGFPVMGMFMQSGGGDAAPGGGFRGHQGEQRSQMLGVSGAPKVIQALEEIEFTGQTELAVRSRLVALRHAWIYGDSGEFNETSAKPHTYGTLNCTIDPVAGISQAGKPKRCAGIELLFGALGAPLPNAESNQVYLTVARLGNLFFMSVPGEPTHSIVDYARKTFAELSPDHELMVVGYSQDHFLYLTHRDDWYLGEYEAEFSAWGPWGAQYLIDRQLELIEDMLGGFNAPTYYEERKNLQPPLEFQPRPVERSLSAGDVIQNVPEFIERMDMLTFVVGGGDPQLGTPHFSIEREHPTLENTFVPVPDRAGRLGQVLGSRHPSTLTFYRPIPENTPEPLLLRDHRWEFVWQIPLHLGTGRYRIVARGSAHTDGPVTWSVPSSVFEIRQDSQATLSAARIGDEIRLHLTHPASPIQKSEGNKWPLSGWWVFDHLVPPTSRQQVQSPLMVSFTVDSVPTPDLITAVWDSALSRHIIPVSALSFDPSSGAIVVRAWLADDSTPDAIEANLQ